MSLGFWFRTYVYIPLGGSWYGAGRTIVNLLIVWGLTGIWHGADATFLIWGLYYGLLLILEKFMLRDLLAKIPAFLRRVGTFFRVARADVLRRSGWISGSDGTVLPPHVVAGAADRAVCGASVWLQDRQPVLPDGTHGVGAVECIFYSIVAALCCGHGERDVFLVPLCAVLREGGGSRCGISKNG